MIDPKTVKPLGTRILVRLTLDDLSVRDRPHLATALSLGSHPALGLLTAMFETHDLLISQYAGSTIDEDDTTLLQIIDLADVLAFVARAPEAPRA